MEVSIGYIWETEQRYKNQSPYFSNLRMPYVTATHIGKPGYLFKLSFQFSWSGGCVSILSWKRYEPEGLIYTHRVEGQTAKTVSTYFTAYLTTAASCCTLIAS
jgi:hypothetical protein